MSRGIYNICYDKIFGVEAFVYHYTQQAYLTIPEVDMFSGIKSGHTISRKTIEKILQEE